MERILSLLILAFYLFNTTYASCIISNEYTVGIDNEILEDGIHFHCKSKDKDLGYRALPSKDHFQWRFCQNFFQTTLYFCHFYWKSKQQVFDVFNRTMGYQCFFGSIAQCQWVVKSDGFYYYNFNSSSLIKNYDWH